MLRKGFGFLLLAFGVIVTMPGCIGGEAPLPPQEALTKASAEIDLILARERDLESAPDEPDAPADPNRVLFWYFSHPLLSKAFPPGRTGAFEAANPGIKLDAQFIGDWPVAVQKLTVSLAAGDMPDIAVVKRSWLARLIPAGRLMPIDELLPTDLTNDLKSNVRTSMGVDGRLYALPADGFCSVLYYNKELVPQAPRTWEELKSAVLQVASKPNAPQALGYLPFMESLWSAGGDVVEDHASGLGSPAGRATMDFLLSLRDAGVYRPSLFVDESSAMESFLRGQVAMTVASSAYTPRLAGLGFAAALAPIPGKAGAVSSLSEDAIVVFRSHAKAKAPAIAKILDYLTGSTVQGVSAVAQGSIPVRASVDAEAPEGLVAAFDAARNTPLLPAWSEIEYTLDRYLYRAFLWKGSVGP